MNFDFLRFEAKLLRLLLGATFVIQAAVLTWRWTGVKSSLQGWSGELKDFPDAFTGGTLLLITGLFAALAAARVLDGIALLGTWLARRAVRSRSRTPTLLLDPAEMARRIILERKQSIRDYHRLRAVGYAANAEQHGFLKPAVEKRLDDVEQFAAAAGEDWEVITAIINFGTITVEQAITDRLNERITTLKAFWIVLGTSGILAVELLGWGIASFMTVAVLLLALAASVSAFAAAKQDAAYHWVFLVYDSIGQFSAAAEETGTTG